MRKGLLNLKNLEKTRSFYNVELKKEDLTETERAKYLKALKVIERLIERLIERKGKAGEKGKHKKFFPYDHKTVFDNNKGYRGY